MPRIAVPFARQFYPARHAPAGRTELVNLSAQTTPSDAKTPFILERVEGIQPFTDFTKEINAYGQVPTKPWQTDYDQLFSNYTYNIRGMWTYGDYVYVIIGNALWRTNASGDNVRVGTSLAGDERCSIAIGTDQTLIVEPDTGDGFVYDHTAETLTQVTDPDFPAAKWAAWMDQYFIVGVANSNTFQISGVADATSWNALEIATAETLPDDLIVGFRDHRDLLLFGTDSVEVWYNSGNVDFPFERAPDGLLEVGCAAPGSVTRIDNAPIWLAQEQGGLSVRRLSGRTPMRISTPAMDDEFVSYINEGWNQGSVADAYAMSWTHSGRAYYALSFPTQYRTFVYDLSAQMWHRRKSWASDQWAVSGTCSFNNQTLVQDSREARIGRLSRDYFFEWFDPFQYQTVTAPVSRDRRLMTFNRVELEIDAGRGLVESDPATQGQEPTLWLSWSDDDGRTWSNEYERSMGERGKYRTRLYWHNCGAARTRVFRIRGADPVPTALIGMWADVEVGV